MLRPAAPACPLSGVDGIEALEHVFIRVLGPSAAAVIVGAVVTMVVWPSGGRLGLALIAGLAAAGLDWGRVVVDTSGRTAGECLELRKMRPTAAGRAVDEARDCWALVTPDWSRLDDLDQGLLMRPRLR